MEPDKFNENKTNLVLLKEKDSVAKVFLHFLTESAKLIQILAERMVTDKSITSKELNTIGSTLSREYNKLSQASLEIVQQGNQEGSNQLRESVLRLGQLCLDLIKCIRDLQANYELSHNIVTQNTITVQLVYQISKQVNEIVHLINSVPAMPSFTKQSCYNNAVKGIETLLHSFVKCSDINGHVSEESLRKPLQAVLKETWILYQLLKMVIANIVSSDCETVAISLANLQLSLAKIAHNVRNFVVISKIEDYEDVLATMEESFLCIINFLIICEEVDEITNSKHNKNLLKSSCTKSVEGIRMFVKEISKHLTT